VRARLAHLTRHDAAGALAVVLSVAAVTGLIYALRAHVPVLALDLLYLLAVLPIAVVWGRWFAIAASVASMLAFNYFFLPPTLKFTLAGGENWLILAVVLVTGVLVAELASRARERARDAERRARESRLLAELSTVLLSGTAVDTELQRIADGTARIVGVPSARIELGSPTWPAHGEQAIALRSGETRIGTLYVTSDKDIDKDVARRFLPAVGSLLGVALEREGLAREALEAEALRRSDLLKTALLRAVSHDLRSPLTAIRVAVESLASPTLFLGERDRAALLETVHAETERLDRVVGNLLDLSRLEAGAAPPDRSAHALDGILVQVLRQLPGHGRVDVSIPVELPLVEVDADQIERVLVNLLENALKFSPADSRVRVRASATADLVVVVVEDDGPGIPPLELERVFEPFRHASTTAENRGTGLGLAIARGFAEANGGGLVARPGPVGGTVVALELPTAAVSIGTPA
jgi:two-component system sensor histidine kinase KdpD